MREFGSKNISKYQTRFLGDWDYNHVEVLSCK
jgi:hypothetical protein